MPLPPGYEEYTPSDKAKLPEGYELVQTPQTWAERLGVSNPLARPLLDFAEGIAAGGAGSFYKTEDAIRRGAQAALGSETATQLGIGRVDSPTGRVIDRPDVLQAMRAPESLAGTLGKFGEQTAEFLIPGTGVTKAVKAAPLLGRMAAEAALAGGVTGLQSGFDPRAMTEAAALGGGVAGATGALRGAPGTAAANMLRESAEKEYARVLNATKQGNKWVSQNIAVPELIDRGYRAFTTKGLLKGASKTADAMGQAIDDAWKALPQGTTAELDPIFNGMKQSATDALTVPLPGGKGVQAVTGYAKNALGQMDNLKQILANVAEADPATGKLVVPVEKLRTLRQAWDEVAAQAKVYSGADLADHASAKIHAMGANAIREKLAQDFPDIAALNKEFNFWKNVKQVVSDTVLRREGQASPLTKQIAGIGGAIGGAAVGGPKGAFLGQKGMAALQGLMQSAAWRTTSAVLKDRLAKEIMQNSQAGALFTIGQMVKAAGRETLPGNLTREAPTLQLEPAMPQ
jgi:hypothetical protein